MRGKPLDLLDGDQDVRLIPAYAGKTFVASAMSGLRGAHPRVCGENRIKSASSSSG